MSLDGLDSTSVRYTKEQACVKKNGNFFDYDDDEDDFETFETFDDDVDVAKMLQASKPKIDVSDDVDEEDVGTSWGGEAYSFQKAKEKPSVANVPVADRTSSLNKSHLQRQSEPNIFRPFDMMSRSKITETSRVVQTSTFKTEGSATTSTRYETGATSIEQVVQKGKSEMTDAERNRMQAEIKELQKTVSSLRQQHKKTPQPGETVKKLMLNEPCVLELYKSLDEKISLLDEAIKLGDGDAIITVLLFLKKTIKPSLFLAEIRKRPVAVRHIISFMKAHYDYDEVIKLLRHLGRKEEAMMLEYKRAVTSVNADSQIQAISTCQRIYETSSDLSDMLSILNEHQTLLKRQVKIEVKDKRTQTEAQNQVMRLHPRKSITSSPLIETLHYCCFYHFGKDDETLGPVSLQKDFKLTDKQFEWTMIGARAELKKWGDLDGLFTSKSWYGTSKLKSNLGFDKVVGILDKSHAPPDILSKYLALIEDLDTRLALATKLKCHQVAVETIVSMKDKQKLDDYRKHLERTHPVQAVISRYLSNSQIKWR